MSSRVSIHPATRLGRYRLYCGWLLIVGALQVVWAGTIFYYSTHPPGWLRAHSAPYFHPGLVYSIYSWLHASYVLIAVGLSVFLASRGWLRAAALGSAIPGLGTAFGIFQVVPGWVIFRDLTAEDWGDFFAWREKVGFGRKFV